MAYTDFDWKRLYKERKTVFFNLLPETGTTKKEKVALIEADLAPRTCPELLVKFVIIWQSKINMEAARASDSSDSERDEDGEHIGDNNNSRLRQSTFSSTMEIHISRKQSMPEVFTLDNTG